MSHAFLWKKQPLPMCDRVKDGDCRWNDDGLVLCHTIRGGVVAEGKRHPDRPYIYCGESDKAQGFGKWLPEHRADDRPQKLRREPKESLFTYWFWDGAEVPVQRRRIDYADDRPKDVRWTGTLNGRPEAEIQPYLWKESTTRLATDGGVLFVVRGELKAELLLSLGHNAISILGISERLIAELRSLGRDVVLCPDCDLADLAKWYSELSRQLAECRHLLSPMKGLNWRQPPEHGGLGVEDWLQTANPDAATINAAISSTPWRSIEEKQWDEYQDLHGKGWTELLDFTLNAIRSNKPDHTMKARAEIKHRFRISDEQLNTALFKRYGEAKVEKVTKSFDSVSLTEIEELNYLMDGWMVQGDVSLLYGPYGTGKTTLAVWKAYCYAQGINILDRNQPCTPGKSLIIATDSGAAALKKSFSDLGIDVDTNPIFKPGHPQQAIWIWAYAPDQGHAAWLCDIHGIIRLEQPIEKHGITYVAIDSAKSVSSAAGWSYTSNESVKALLKHLREGICTPFGCNIEFLSHDGTEKGSHSGAKAWAEDPSMVCARSIANNPDGKACGVTVNFRKDRAAAVEPRRSLTYSLTDEELVLRTDVEVVGNCEDAILTILWDNYQNGVKELRTAAICDAAKARFNKTRKTVENTLPNLKRGKTPKVVTAGRGRVSLSPAEIQKRQQAEGRESIPNRTLSKTGGGKKEKAVHARILPSPQ